MHKLDSMMMKNVRSAAINADCVLVVVDACKVPEKVCFIFCRIICETFNVSSFEELFVELSFLFS